MANRMRILVATACLCVMMCLLCVIVEKCWSSDKIGKAYTISLSPRLMDESEYDNILVQEYLHRLRKGGASRTLPYAVIGSLPGWVDNLVRKGNDERLGNYLRRNGLIWQVEEHLFRDELIGGL